jgi:hypothetical protein
MNKLIGTLAVLFVLMLGCFCFLSETEAQPQNLRKAGPFAFSGTAATITSTGDIKSGGNYYLTTGDQTLIYQLSGAGLAIAAGLNGANTKYFLFDTNGVATCARGFVTGNRLVTPVSGEFSGSSSVMLWCSNNVVYLSVWTGAVVSTKQLLP